MDAVTAYNEIVYLIKLHAIGMTQKQYREWLDSDLRWWVQLFYDGGLTDDNFQIENYERISNYFIDLTVDQRWELSDWLLTFVNRSKLNKNFKELV